MLVLSVDEQRGNSICDVPSKYSNCIDNAFNHKSFVMSSKFAAFSSDFPVGWQIIFIDKTQSINSINP